MQEHGPFRWVCRAEELTRALLNFYQTVQLNAHETGQNQRLGRTPAECSDRWAVFHECGVHAAVGVAKFYWLTLKMFSPADRGCGSKHASPFPDDPEVVSYTFVVCFFVLRLIAAFHRFRSYRRDRSFPPGGGGGVAEIKDLGGKSTTPEFFFSPVPGWIVYRGGIVQDFQYYSLPTRTAVLFFWICSSFEI